MQRPYDINYLMFLLENLSKTRRINCRISQLSEIKPGGIPLIIRCDVERSPENAVSVASRLEKLNISASFYFHTKKNVYDVERMIQIREMGHEVGYHHQCLERTQGDFEKAKRLFIQDVEMFKSDGLPLKTVCGHSELFLPRKGFSRNAELFERYPDLLKELNLNEAYFLVRKLNRKVKINFLGDNFYRTCGLYESIRNVSNSKMPLHILLHPHRWRNWFHQTLLIVSADIFRAARMFCFRKVGY